MFKRILVPTDGSEIAAKGVAAGIELAKVLGAEIIAITVVPPSKMYHATSEVAVSLELFEQQQKNAYVLLKKIYDTCTANNVKCRVFKLNGILPSKVIADEADEYKCDLIVMGSSPKRDLLSFLLGSETKKVLSRTTVPVLIVR